MSKRVAFCFKNEKDTYGFLLPKNCVCEIITKGIINKHLGKFGFRERNNTKTEYKQNELITKNVKIYKLNKNQNNGNNRK